MSSSLLRVVVVSTLLLPAIAGAQSSPPPPAPSPPVEPAAPPAEPEDGVDWRYDKGLAATSADGDFELKLGLRTQTRLEVNHREASGEFESRFFLPRIRLQLEGFAYGEANTYKIEYDLGNQGFSALKDFFVERAMLPAVRLRVGQWKKPFSRQELISDFGLGLIDRNATGAWAGAGRDLGVALHNGYEKSPDGVEWALGVFNGTSERSSQKLTCKDPADPATCTLSLPSNVPTDFLPELVARLGWNQGAGDGIKGYSELDLEGGPLRVAVGASYRVRLNDLVGSDALEHAAELDALLKVHGFDLQAAGFVQKKGLADPEVGGYGQAGLVAVPRRLAVVARFGVTPADDSDKHKLELVGGLDLFAAGHSYKLVLEGGNIHDTHSKIDDAFGRAQLQLVF
jgi:hypothetical protein